MVNIVLVLFYRLVKVCECKPDTENKNKYGVVGLMNIHIFSIRQRLMGKSVCYAVSVINYVSSRLSVDLLESALRSISGTACSATGPLNGGSKEHEHQAFSYSSLNLS